MSIIATITESQITLEKGRKELSIALGAMSRDSFQMESYEDIVMGKIIRASFDVLRDKIHEDRTTVYFEYKTPENWVEQLKKEHAPKWLKNKYPVKYTTHRKKRTAVFKRYAEYPKSNIAIPKDSKLYIERLGNLEVIHDEVY